MGPASPPRRQLSERLRAAWPVCLSRPEGLRGGGTGVLVGAQNVSREGVRVPGEDREGTRASSPRCSRVAFPGCDETPAAPDRAPLPPMATRKAKASGLDQEKYDAEDTVKIICLGDSAVGKSK